MHALGTEPVAVLAVEDSTAGVMAARAAGIAKVCGFTGFTADKAAAERALLAAGAVAVFGHWRKAVGTIGRVASVSGW